MGEIMKKQSTFLFILFLITGIVVGGLITTVAGEVSWLKFLTYGQTFNIGYPSPFDIDLGFIKFSFGFQINVSIALIISMILSYFVYRWLIRK